MRRASWARVAKNKRKIDVRRHIRWLRDRYSRKPDATVIGDLIFLWEEKLEQL